MALCSSYYAVSLRRKLASYQGRSKELRGNAPTLCCTYSFMTAMAYRWGADTAAGNSAMGIGAHLRSDTRHVTSYATMAPRQVPKMAYGLSCACKFSDLSGADQVSVHWSKERKRARQLLCTFKWTQPKCKHNHSTVLRNSKQTERQSSAVATLTLCLAAGPQDCPRVGSKVSPDHASPEVGGRPPARLPAGRLWRCPAPRGGGPAPAARWGIPGWTPAA